MPANALPLRIWLVLALGFLLVSAPALSPADAPPAQPQGRGHASQPSPAPCLRQKLDELLDRPQLRGASVGAYVIDLPSGRELYARGGDQPLIPASNMKLVTMAAALELLGEGYRFRTIVALDGANLVVIGSGDPAIGSGDSNGDPAAEFRQWARHLRQRGITSIQGDLLLDDSLFDRQFVHPNWPRDQLDRWYAAPIGALALSGNCVEVVARPGEKVGQPGRVALRPPNSGLSIAGTIRTVGSPRQHLWGVSRAAESDAIQVRGRFFQDAGAASARVTVADPTRFFGNVLAGVLRREGVRLTGKVRTLREPSASRLAPQVIHETALLPLLPLMGKESQNFTAEQLFKAMGAAAVRGQGPGVGGQGSGGGALGAGSWASGRAAVRQYLRRHRMPVEGVYIDDGSGLSRENRVTARFLTALLEVVFNSPYGRSFRESLAVVGEDGTLEKRLTEPPYRGRVWAKTGTIAHVYALSGYVQTRDGRWRAFSLLVNNAPGGLSRVQDEFCRVLIDE